MPYPIQKSDGTVITVEDGNINNVNTSLTLVGKNFPGYGVFLNQNFVRLLENFSNSAPPSNAIIGQLWWDKQNKLLKVNQGGTSWKVISSAMSLETEPDTDVPGDLWWDKTNNQLKVFTGGSTGTWVTIGPAFTASTGRTGAIADLPVDTNGQDRPVIKFFVQDDLVSILSKEETAFSPTNPAINSPGFTTILPGFNLSSAIEGIKFNGVATEAETVSGIESGALARTDEGNDFQGDQIIRGDLSIGTSTNPANNEITIAINTSSTSQSVYPSGRATLTTSSGYGISISTAGRDNQLLIASNGEVRVSSDPISANGVATKSYVDGKIDGTLAGQVGVLKRDGSVSLTGTLVPDDAGIDVGSANDRFDVVYANTFNGDTFTGTSVRANYADLAERFEADAEYQAGTVVELGGSAEITKVGDDLSDSVFGVISTRAAYLMNAGAGGDATHPPVAVSGRVPVRVIGKVRKGDRLVSAGNGLARAGTKQEITPWNVIGRALTNKDTSDEGTIEAIVKLNS